ncbi:MAG: hypothetical protein NUW37_02950 [Planctomycetes bacterium]|nr:hypothetical protein [Planctomycetota bacterium]
MHAALKVDRTNKKGYTLVVVSGVVDGAVDVERIFSGLSGKIIIETAKVERYTTTGANAWMHYAKKLSESCDITYRKCSYAFIEQANLLSDFLGSGKVESFYAPYVNFATDKEYMILLDVNEHFKDRDLLEAPPLPAPDDDVALEFDEDDAEFFAFLRIQFDKESGVYKGDLIAQIDSEEAIVEIDDL